jgi:hypothetical protein
MRKKTVLFIVLLLSIFAVHAQRLDTLSSHSRQQYLKYIKKRSTYKTLGWVLLGTGVALFGTAYLINVENGWNGEDKAENLFAAGFIAAAVSPPFFILAGISKRKARLALKGERLTSAIMFQRPYFPAISLKINL